MKSGGLIILTIIILLIVPFVIPQTLQIPVAGANSGSYNHNSYWAYPWGKSITHKGVDIFAPKGTAVVSATHGIVFSTGVNGRGGNIALVLGPKWRVHYYAHLEKTLCYPFQIVQSGQKIGTVGDSGNAKGKPPHLHYVIATPIPYLWRMDMGIQGYLKCFYLNPVDYF